MDNHASLPLYEHTFVSSSADLVSPSREQILRRIYGRLLNIERQCMKFGEELKEPNKELSPSEWRTLVSFYRALLEEHYCFFVTSQHPSATHAVKALALEHYMPARLWRYGIEPCLTYLKNKWLRHRESAQNPPLELQEYALHFIYLAYHTFTLFLQDVAVFDGIWIECLGDLARYRVAFELNDSRERKVWEEVAKGWYNQCAHRSPGIGHFYNHLGILAQPDVLKQLFYYTKAVIAVIPFDEAYQGIDYLTRVALKGKISNEMVSTFVQTHSILLNRGSSVHFLTCANHFLSLLQRDLSRLHLEEQGVYIMCCNFAALLRYSDTDAIIAPSAQENGSTTNPYYNTRTETSHERPSPQRWVEAVEANHDNFARGENQAALRKSGALVFKTFSCFLDGIENPNTHAAVHTSLVFIWYLAHQCAVMQQLEDLIPWLEIIKLLNTIFSGRNAPFHQAETFLSPEHTTPKPLPEDLLIRGQAWSEPYYPSDFFEGVSFNDEYPLTEKVSRASYRAHRCFWLGVQLAMVGLLSLLHE
ncbi:hypothetical protein N7492_009743 [Penicillium capsulatum]|uniref:DNA/RNA-binding domain-containing protein n=1 Tax=Penicillium capsulatum TaxID=69766 RepID=A0A9W9HLV2_9EURO|nr:hypothetical protein N7492_009743 [Penicillium capsulatum]KAJ6114175.1 hypothetical protein N7512_007620 [Penicillium capsulatum]